MDPKTNEAARGSALAHRRRAHLLTVLLGFAGLGFFIGVYSVLLADLARAFGLSQAALGVALGAFSGVGILSLLVGGRIADRTGRRPFLVAGAAVAGLFFLALAVLAGSKYPLLLAAVVLGGAGSSLYDLAVNSLGGDHERHHETKAMTLLHAGWSAGAALGALGSGVALWLGADFRAIYAVCGALLLLLGVLFLGLPLPPHEDAGPGPEDDAEGHERVDPEATGVARRAVMLVPGVLVATALVTLTFLTDSALVGFSSLYLREVLGSGALLGAAGIAAFHSAGLVGRLTSARAIRRFGERAVIAVGALGAALGLALVAATGNPVAAALGLLLTGVSLSPIVPVGFSLAARSAPGRSARAISAVTVVGYGTFLVGPVLVGVLADLLTLRTALALFVPTSLLMAAFAYRGLER